jgi:hypothetical protein
LGQVNGDRQRNIERHVLVQTMLRTSVVGANCSILRVANSTFRGPWRNYYHALRQIFGGPDRQAAQPRHRAADPGFSRIKTSLALPEKYLVRAAGVSQAPDC